MLHSKVVVSNLVKASMIVLLILSCIPFVGCGKGDNVDTLIQKLKNKDEDVRWRAAYALGKIKDARAVEPLIAALKDENRNVREDAAWVLGEIKDNRAVEPLIAALKEG